MSEQNNLLNIVSPVAAASSALTAQALGIGVGLQAIGDLIGYFRTDYEIKGQTLANPEDLYIQAMVAEDLVSHGRPVYLLNFNFIRRSELIETLGSLLKQKYEMLSASEKINSAYVAGVQVQIDALQADLKSLNEKWIECLVKADNNIVPTLRAEIDAVEKQLSAAQAQRTPTSQITALEKHIADLRTKLVDELLEDTDAAIAAVESEIEAIIAKLKKNARDKKLTGVEVKALNDQLKLLQTKRTDLVAATRNNTAAILENKINTASDQLRQEQRSSLPDSHISNLEEHLAALRAKLLECLLRNDNDVKANLDAEIASKKREIESLQKSVGEASGIINQATKVNAAIDAFVSTIATVPAGASHPPLVTACIRESLSNDTIRYILKVKLMSSGGDFITEDTPFYSRAVKTSYTGGGVVSYVMAEKDGQIVASGTVSRASALDHRLGEEPELRDWNIRTPENNTPGRTASLLLNLLLASSVAYMLLALVGAVIAIGENRPAAAAGLDSGASAVQAFLSGGGTVFSPPLYLLVVQAFFTVLAFRRDRLGSLGVVGLSVLGLLFGVGMLAEPILAEIFKPGALEGFKVLLAAGLIVIPFVMMGLGISEWRRRSAEK